MGETELIRTLIVEDDFHVARIHGAYISRVRGFRLAGHAATLASARFELAHRQIDLVLLDLYLPDGHGLDLVRELADAPAGRPDFLIITAARDMASVRAAMQLGTVHYLVKPFAFEQLEERLRAYRDLHSRLHRLREAEQHEVDSLFGLLRGPAPLPKGQSGPTMARIRELLGEAGELSAGEVAAQVGISRSTAQRYLSELARQGRVQINLRYGATGRPEHRYRLAEP